MGAGPHDLTWRDYLAPVVARRWLIAAIVVIIGAGVYAYYARQPAVYKASTKLYVGQQGNPVLGVSPSLGTDRSVADQASLVNTVAVAAVVARDIGYSGSPSALAGSVTATPVSGQDLITITAQGHRPAEAARIANGFAQAYIQLNNAQNRAAIAKSLAQLQKQLRQLPPGPAGAPGRIDIAQETEQLQIDEATGVGSPIQINPAHTPTARSNRPPWEYALFAALAGLIGAVLLAYLLARLDTRLKSVDQALEVYGRPVLAVILHDSGINAFKDGVPALPERSREAFRQLRVALDVTALERHFKTILITSAGPGEGKSSVARNLALAYAEAGRRTALIDADLRKPKLPAILRIRPEIGLCDVLAGNATLDDVVTWVPTADVGVSGPMTVTVPGGESGDVSLFEARGISFLPAGATPPNPPAVIESEGFRSLIHQLGEDQDVVVIDSTPMTAVSDVIPLLSHVDAVLLVARSGTTNTRGARHAVDVIGRVPNVNFVGVVVNSLPAAEAAVYGTGYGYGYDYGNGDRSRVRRLITRS